MTTTKRTAGRWSEQDAPVYFRAHLLHQLMKLDELQPTSGLEEPTVLVAVSDIGGDEDIEYLKAMSRSKKVLLDSGVFSLAMAHARKNNVSHDEALRSPIESIDGIDTMLAKWRKAVSSCGHDLWGYIEFDIGGREQKKKMRATLESEGFSPIPVFHPLNDGWEYFDELASTYERICVGNLVKAPRDTRVAILCELAQRRKGTALKWIHSLGVTPSPVFVSSPTESCDSTSWASDIMFGGEAMCFEGFIGTHTDLHYVRQQPERVYYSRMKALAASASCMSKAMRHHFKETR